MSNTEDLTEQFQEWYGDKLKVNRNTYEEWVPTKELHLYQKVIK